MPRYISPEKRPTEWEREVLDILEEECCEVGQRAIKVERFGVKESQPGQPLTNKERLGREIGQLLFMIDLAQSYGLVDLLQMKVGYAEKPDQLRDYMQTEPPGGWDFWNPESVLKFRAGS